MSNMQSERYENLSTSKYDPRFPNTNQTRNCWTNYVDYQRCIRAKGEDAPQCSRFKRTYRSLCPVPWVQKWDELVAENRFPGQDLYVDAGKKSDE